MSVFGLLPGIQAGVFRDVHHRSLILKQEGFACPFSFALSFLFFSFPVPSPSLSFFAYFFQDFFF